MTTNRLNFIATTPSAQGDRDVYWDGRTWRSTNWSGRSWRGADWSQSTWSFANWG